MLFRNTAQETGAKLLDVEVGYRPRSPAPPSHYPPFQEERFEVLSGAIQASIAAQGRTYSSGDAFTVPRDTPHTMQNVGDEEARVIWRVLPALRTAEFFEAMWTLPDENRNLFSLAAIIRDFSTEFRLTRPPYLVQRPLFALWAPLGRMLSRRR